MLTDLSIELARFGISWSGLRHPLRELTLTDIVQIDDNLNEFYLLGRIHFVDRAGILVTEHINKNARSLNVNPPTSDK